jgi:hypothetical protein
MIRPAGDGTVFEAHGWRRIRQALFERLLFIELSLLTSG